MGGGKNGTQIYFTRARDQENPTNFEDAYLEMNCDVFCST